VVEAFDIRPAAREEVQSLGATFVGIDLPEETRTAEGYAREVSPALRQREQELIRQHLARADVVIATAQVPGKPAPLLITDTMVAAMQPGSVIVDLAAEQGGNCACTAVGQTVLYHGVTILGPRNVPSLMPGPASQMYASNLAALVHHLVQEGVVQLDFTDAITKGACVTHAGRIQHEAVRQAVAAARGMTGAERKEDREIWQKA
jgi:NAD(P) transhydrogenase subunit alpha